MPKPLLTLAAATLALSISGTAQASLSLGPPQASAIAKTTLAPALPIARFTRLPRRAESRRPAPERRAGTERAPRAPRCASYGW